MENICTGETLAKILIYHLFTYLPTYLCTLPIYAGLHINFFLSVKIKSVISNFRLKDNDHGKGEIYNL